LRREKENLGHSLWKPSNPQKKELLPVFLPLSKCSFESLAYALSSFGASMRRREFIAILGGAVASFSGPLPLGAQAPSRTYRLGVLIPSARQTPPLVAFFDELRLNGFSEGQNLEVIPGGLNIRNEQVAEHVAAIVKAAPDAIVSGGLFATRAVQAGTRTIPHVAISEDMVGDGFVVSLSRTGSNTTGISILSPELDGKRQELLIEATPGVRAMAVLADSSATSSQHLKDLQEAARARNVTLSIFTVSRPEEIGPAMDQAKASGAQALNALASPIVGNYSNGLFVIERAAALRLPTMHQWPDMAEDGGFAAYGPRMTEIFRQEARMIVKVLRGTKPADMPVEQPTRFELVINLKTAKAMGQEIPLNLLLRADKIIE
jgi:putative ABC transport system substrate-binding protein